MTLANETAASLKHADRFFIGGTWVQPSSDATIRVIDSTNEEVFLTVAEAQDDGHRQRRRRRPGGIRQGSLAPDVPCRDGPAICGPWPKG